MTYFDTSDLRDTIADESSHEEHLLFELGDSPGEKYYELFWVPAKDEWLILMFDTQLGGQFVGFADLRECLDEIEDEIIIAYYNRYISEEVS